MNGALVPGIADLVPLLGGGSSTFTLPINAPGTVRALPSHQHTLLACAAGVP